MHNVRIPFLHPPSLDRHDPLRAFGSPQPIIQLKELAVDEARYHLWKESLKKRAGSRPWKQNSA
jgi:hypothetical protein